MRISVVKEIKPQESRVGLAPSGPAELVNCGHTVFVETGASSAKTRLGRTPSSQTHTSKMP